MKLSPTFLVMSAVLTSFGMAQTTTPLNPKQQWKNREGKSFQGTFIRSDLEKVWFKVNAKEFSCSFSDLIPTQQEMVKRLSSDFSWRYNGDSATWPVSIPVFTLDAAKEEPMEGKPGHFRYVTAKFEFECDAKIGGKAAAKVGRIFEAYYQLVLRLPWNLRPEPPVEEEGKTSTRYKVRLMSSRATFEKSLKGMESNNPNPSSGKIMGVYFRHTRTIHVPFDSVGLVEKNGVWEAGSDFSSETLRHELIHQLTHSILDVLPWWLSEGIAEYLAKIPLSSSGEIKCGNLDSKPYLAKLAGEGEATADGFKGLMAPGYRSVADNWHSEMTRNRSHLESQLDDALERRAERFAAIKAEMDGKLSGMPKAEGEPNSSAQPSKRVSPVPLNDQQLMKPQFDRYHNAKLLICAFQDLQQTKGRTTMNMIMWHFRQWADERAVQLNAFSIKKKAFDDALDGLIKKINTDKAVLANYSAAMEKYFSDYVSNNGSTKLPVPEAPEQQWLKELPVVPDKGQLGAAGMIVRCEQILATLIPKDDKIYELVREAFAEKDINISAIPRPR